MGAWTEVLRAGSHNRSQRTMAAMCINHTLPTPDGEWSVPTLSMTPSASPCSRRRRFSPSRSGGAHLNLRAATWGRRERDCSCCEHKKGQAAVDNLSNQR